MMIRNDARRTGYGMTLVELLVVLAVIGLILGVSVPAFVKYGKQARLKASTRQIIGLVSLARQLAISSREEHAVQLDPDEKTIHVMNLASSEILERSVTLPRSISIDVQIGGESSSITELVFRTSGSLVGRTTEILLSNGEQTRTISIIATTGAISVN